MSHHADFLRLCLPPVSYDLNGVLLSAELVAVANQLDAALLNADSLIAEMHSNSTVQSLADYERVYGLPDLCVTVAQTLEQRRAALTSKVLAKGGQSRAYFIGIAAAMGYAGATIDEFSAQIMTCDGDCNGFLYSDADSYVWRLNLPLLTGGVFFATCNSDCNSALQSWGNQALECRIKQLKPAYTTVIFAYF